MQDQIQGFPAGAPVLMADSSRKPIEQVKVDDVVVSGMFRERRVTATTRRVYSGEMIGLNVRGVEGPIVCTAGHEIATHLPGKIGLEWEAAGKLCDGMEVFHSGGTHAVHRVKRQQVTSLTVYDFEVEEDRCFVVNGITVSDQGAQQWK